MEGKLQNILWGSFLVQQPHDEMAVNNFSGGIYLNKIAIVGPYPLPYGGISIHIERVLDILEMDKKIEYDFYDESKKSLYHKKRWRFYGKYQKIKMLLKLLLTPYKLIHYHSPNTTLRIIFCIYGLFGKNIYLHIHGASLEDTIYKKNIKSKLLGKLLCNVHVLSDNSRISTLVRCYSPKSICEIDAFLPPLYNSGYYDDFREKYLLKLDVHEKPFVIGMVGWFRVYHNEDLYGFDLMIHALQELVGKYNVHLIASVNGIADQWIYDQCAEKIKEFNLAGNITFIFDELPDICSLYLVSDVFVRPTNTDGNALSIKEALWFETKTIASDCVPRPKEAILFKNRDVVSLKNAIEREMINIDNRVSIDQKIEIIQNKQFNNRLFEEIYYAEE